MRFKIPPLPPTDLLLDRLVLLLLAAMVVVPFQHAHHYNPIPSFLAEWWAAALGLAACAAAFLRPSVWERFPLPRILLLPLLLIGGLMLQFALGMLAFVEQGLLMAACLLWASLMACLGRDLARRRGLEWLADGLAAAFVAGALLQVLSMVLQAGHVGYRTGLVFPRQGALYGNLGQANHLNDYLWLGIASALYLHHRSRMNLGGLITLVCILLLASTLSTSRSILLYAFALGVLGWIAGRQTPDMARLKRISLALLPVAFVSLLLSRELAPFLLPTDVSSSDTLQRFYAEANGNNIRIKLWREALYAIAQSPWLGHGVGSIPWQYFSLAEFWPEGDAAPVAEHVHNLPLQWMVEFGAPIALAGFGLASAWLYAFLRAPLTEARWWLLAILAVMGIHSLLEYPLWYTFFLGPFALLLGAGDNGQRILANGRRGLVAFALIVALSGSIFGLLRKDYLDMERILNWRIFSGTVDLPAAVKRLLEIQANSLLAPQATVSFALMMEPVKDQLEDRRALCQSAMKFAPTERVVFKCATLDAMAGDPEAAAHLRRALAAFPESSPKVKQELLSQSKAMPELANLLKEIP
ncbi:MAG: hypothetical protein EKK46_01750 [Rhodocyclaceae bacterium]|nr:MAG: hypothetical protein EKK46_01750 [Rhodocyclaceae bacterium]